MFRLLDKIRQFLEKSPPEIPEDEFDFDEDGSGSFRGISSLEIEVGFPKISTSVANMPDLIETSAGETGATAVARGLTPTERKRIRNIENNMRRIAADLKMVREYRQNTFSEIRDLFDSLKDLERRLEAMENSAGSPLLGYEKNLQDLSALYELLTAQFNPFISTDPGEVRDGMLHVMDETTGEKERGLTADFWTVKWLDFLVQRMDKRSAIRLLQYYRNLGWLDDHVHAKAIELLGMAAVSPDVKRGNAEGWQLSSEDQTTSMKYIARIRGIELDVRDPEIRGNGSRNAPVEKRTGGG